MSRRSRLDQELVRRGLAASRSSAQQLIEQGRITVDGAPAGKPAYQVATAQSVVVSGDDDQWASRAGYKLDGVLDALGVNPSGRRCLDAGASTGGFTDVLLQRGASVVLAVDVGYGQLRWHLQTDERVTVMDRTNARHLRRADVGHPLPDLAVADLSFISLRLVLPALIDVTADAGDLVVMVKPQFELDPADISKGGVVRDPEKWAEALQGVAAVAVTHGRAVAGAQVSPLPGPSGNFEFFLHLRNETATLDTQQLLSDVVAQGVALVQDRVDK